MSDGPYRAANAEELRLLREVRRRADDLAGTFVHLRPVGEGGAAVRVEVTTESWDELRDAIGELERFELDGDEP